jgi:hypothetical protein
LVFQMNSGFHRPPFFWGSKRSPALLYTCYIDQV